MRASTNLLPEYRRLRATLRQHQNAALETIPTTPFRRYAREFGLLQGDQLLLESESELTILVDFCLYHHRQRGKTLIERYFDRQGEPTSEDERVLRGAVRDRRFSIFKVQRTQPGVGLAVLDLARGDQLFLVDEALSSTAEEGRLLAGNLLPLPGYWMTTGALIPFPAEFIADEMLSPPLAADQPLSPESETELARDTIAWAIATGTASLVIYQ